MMQTVNPDDFTSQAQAEQDKQLLVRFYYKARQDPAASEQAGRPVYRDVPYVEIRSPGSRDFVARPAKPTDISRFQAHYDAFIKRTAQDERLQGTPLAEWPAISRSKVEELSFFNVRTVEDLANMSDGNAGQIMGGLSLKSRAQDWLETAEAARKAGELQRELAARDAEIEELKAAVAALQKAPRKKVTRKKKATTKQE